MKLIKFFSQLMIPKLGFIIWVLKQKPVFEFCDNQEKKSIYNFAFFRKAMRNLQSATFFQDLAHFLRQKWTFEHF